MEPVGLVTGTPSWELWLISSLSSGEQVGQFAVSNAFFQASRCSVSSQYSLGNFFYIYVLLLCFIFQHCGKNSLTTVCLIITKKKHQFLFVFIYVFLFENCLQVSNALWSNLLCCPCCSWAGKGWKSQREGSEGKEPKVKIRLVLP